MTKRAKTNVRTSTPVAQARGRVHGSPPTLPGSPHAAVLGHKIQTPSQRPKTQTKSRSKSRSKSSQVWLQEHFHDSYVRRAQQAKLPARSVFKLAEIDAQEHLIRPEMAVVDLGCAPGGWSIYIKSRLSSHGQLWALDRLPLARPIPGVHFILGDFTEPAVVAQLTAAMQGQAIDLVCSDMAPNLSGIADFDQLRSLQLAEQALVFARQVLKPGGTLLIKLFQSQESMAYCQRMSGYFANWKILKPPASRARSREFFLLAAGFRS